MNKIKYTPAFLGAEIELQPHQISCFSISKNMYTLVMQDSENCIHTLLCVHWLKEISAQSAVSYL